MNWETIACFGDSITHGARSYLGYPEYMGDILTDKLAKRWNIINHAVNGYTAIDLARSINRDFSNIKLNNPLLSTILIGTNDAQKNTPVKEYSIALEQVIIKTKLLTLNQHVLLLTLPLFFDGVMYPYKKGMNELLNDYNTVIREKAALHQLNSLSVDFTEDMFYDGVHLTHEGSRKVAEKIAGHILAERGILHE